MKEPMPGSEEAVKQGCCCPVLDNACGKGAWGTQDKLKSEPALANTKLGVKANAKSVTLTGLVDTERQHDLALRIAQSYAGDRKIVDKIKIRGQA